MFKMQIAKHQPTQRLASGTRKALDEEFERRNELPESDDLYSFTLYDADGDAGVTVISGVIVNFKFDQNKDHIRRDNQFILDSLQLEGTRLDLDSLPASLEDLLRRWQRSVSLTYGDLLNEFDGLDEQTTVLLPSDQFK